MVTNGVSELPVTFVYQFGLVMANELNVGIKQNLSINKFAKKSSKVGFPLPPAAKSATLNIPPGAESKPEEVECEAALAVLEKTVIQNKK